MMPEVLGWHFLYSDRRLQFEPRTLVTEGLTLEVEPPIELCNRGLHASKRAIDALQYAPGPILCRVRCEGEVIEDRDKLVCTKRTCLVMVDAINTLHEFACVVAEKALLREREKGCEPDARAWEAIRVKRAWLKGDATDDQLAAAGAAAGAADWHAARDAAGAAAKAAAWHAAGAADWHAARDAAGAAAKAAAWHAARDAAKAAAWHAAWYAAQAAARNAARDAARAAAGDEQNVILESMFESLLSQEQGITR
jgi:hypothetical protein